MRIEKTASCMALKMFKGDLRHSMGLLTGMEKPCLWQLAKDFLFFRELFIIVGDCVWCVFEGIRAYIS